MHYLLEISYKSGYSFRMWFKDFRKQGTAWTWETSSNKIQPLILGVDDVVSVIQLDVVNENNFVLDFNKMIPQSK